MANMVLNSDIYIRSENVQTEKFELEQNRLHFEVSGGFNEINMVEELLALTHSDDIEFMYDITMQLITGKVLSVFLRNDNGELKKLTDVAITSRYMDLKGDDVLAEYPFIFECFMRFTTMYLLKKYPPLSSLSSQKIEEKKELLSTGMKKTKKGSIQSR